MLYLAMAAAGVVAILALLVFEYRRIKRLKYMLRAEIACGEFGKIRHELMLAYAAGQISPDDQGFEFLHLACTRVLHSPEFLREFSTYYCLAVATDSLPPSPKPKLMAGDLTDVTRPLVARFVQNVDALTHQFADPVLVFLAAMTGSHSVLHWAHRVRDAKRELARRRQELEDWRQAGAAALSPA